MDLSFGTQGTVKVSCGSLHNPIGFYRDAQERFVIAAAPDDTNNDFPVCLTRLLPDGKTDTSFGINGHRFVHGAVPSMLFADGTLVGLQDPLSSKYDFTLSKLTADGSPDTSFGPGGLHQYTAVPGWTSDFWAINIGAQSDGSIIVAGFQVNDSSRGRPWVVRISPSGAIDRTFGPAGMGAYIPAVSGELTTFDIDALRVLPDDRILIAGGSESEEGAAPDRLSFVVLSTDGVPDPTFAGDGVRTVARIDDGDVERVSLAVNPDRYAQTHSVVTAYSTSTNGLRVARIDLDAGHLRNNWGFRLRGADIDSLEGIYLGETSTGAAYLSTRHGRRTLDRFVWRIRPDGVVDRTFDLHGYAYPDPTALDSFGFVLDPNDRPLLIRTTYADDGYSGPCLCMVRLLGDESPHASVRLRSSFSRGPRNALCGMGPHNACHLTPGQQVRLDITASASSGLEAQASTFATLQFYEGSFENFVTSHRITRNASGRRPVHFSFTAPLDRGAYRIEFWRQASAKTTRSPVYYRYFVIGKGEVPPPRPCTWCENT